MTYNIFKVFSYRKVLMKEIRLKMLNDDIIAPTGAKRVLHSVFVHNQYKFTFLFIRPCENVKNDESNYFDQTSPGSNQIYVYTIHLHVYVVQYVQEVVTHFI